MGVKKYCLVNAKVIYFKKAAARESLKKWGKTPIWVSRWGHKPVYAIKKVKSFFFYFVDSSFLIIFASKL